MILNDEYINYLLEIGIITGFSSIKKIINIIKELDNKYNYLGKKNR